MAKIYGVIIIGSGPAGYTAAIYAARADLSVLVLQGYQTGGQLMQTSEVENFPGFEDGILGPEMMDKFEKQALRFGAEMLPEDAISVDFSQRPFTIRTDTNVFQAHAVIIATGASAKWLGLPKETHFQGRGVTACATCDGFFFKGKDVIVVGGGDTAMEEAIFLTRYVNHVTLVHRRATLRASKIMQDRARNHPKINFVLESEIIDILGDDSVRGAVLRNIVTDHRYRQAVTAAGDGCRAALDLEHWLESKGVDVGIEN